MPLVGSLSNVNSTSGHTSDDDSSHTSTPTPSTPFSLTSPPHFLQAPPSQPEQPSDPYIRDLITKGVRHINYSRLKSKRELGSVSEGATRFGTSDVITNSVLIKTCHLIECPD